MDTATLDRYIQLSRSPDTEKRRQAIIALGKSKNPVALRPLAEIYRSEQEAELRELALRAGQFIKSQAQVAPPVAPVAPPAPLRPAEEIVVVSPFTVDLDDDALPEEQTEAPTGAAVQMHRLTKAGHGAAKQAKAYAEEALTLSLRDDFPKAVKAIKKAYQLYPPLMDDTYYVGLATTVLRCEEGEVLNYLQDASRTEGVLKTIAQEKVDKDVQAHVEETRKMSWLGVALDLSIFSLIMALGPVMLLVIVGQSLEGWLTILEAEGGEMDRTIRDIMLVTRAVDPGALVTLGVTLLISGIVSLVVQCLGIHYSATRLLGGKGTLRFLMYKLISYYNRILLTYLVTLMLTIWLFVSNGVAVIMIPVFIGLALFGLTRLIKLGDRIGEAYKFNTGGGCIPVVVAGLVLVISNGAIAYIVYLVLGNVVVNLLPRGGA